MKPEQFKRVEALYRKVAELPPEEIPEFLDTHCVDEPEVRAEIERLLSQDSMDASALCRDFGGTLRRAEDAGGIDAEGSEVGPYKLLRRIGEGGMGTVYEAEQEKPVRRRVALKLVKWGMDTRQVIARFESERQALALMNHPNIARVYEAGATQLGRPYFAMEYVKGVPITEYCDTLRLPMSERLELFMQVCDGVQHAHQKGVIHRDLKPSNVLVKVQDNRPVPKIIDFGVAKATSLRLTEKTVFTEFGQLIGTPEYMSPEQAEMTGLDIDTRTDVYSLGVLLYELLVGALPFDPDELRSSGFDEIRRKIREDEPSRPSTRVSTLGEGSTKSATARRTDLRSLQRQLTGDLDWITMKSLEKDRTRRYASASELAADLGRHLRNEPVLAGPPGAGYRLRKFVRRNRLSVSLSSVLAILLTGFATFMAIERQRSHREALTAKQVSDFLVDLFEVSDPSEARGSAVTAREILDKGAKRIEEELRDQPLVQARLMATMGRVYRNLGLYGQSESVTKGALELRRGVLGEDHMDTLESVSDLAWLYYRQGRYREAEPLLTTTLAADRRTRRGDHPGTLESMKRLAVVYEGLGRFDEAELLYVEGLEGRRRVLGDDDPMTLQSTGDLAILYAMQGRYDEAEPLFVDTLRIQRRTLEADHPDLLDSLNNLGHLYQQQARYDEAEPFHLEALSGRRRVLGDDHPRTLLSMSNLAELYRKQGRFEDAEPLFVQVLEGQRRALDDEHPRVLLSLTNLALLFMDQGRHDEAELILDQVLESRRRALGDDNAYTLEVMGVLASLYLAQGRHVEAEALHSRTLEAKRRVLGPDHPTTLGSMANLADVYRDQGRYDEAEALYREALEKHRRVLGEDHPGTRDLIRDLATVSEAGRSLETETP